MSIPLKLLDVKDPDSVTSLIQVRRERSATAMLGDFNVDDDVLLFKPVVPLSPGVSYNIVFREKILGSIRVPPANSADAPELLIIYPTIDTVPENLLKIYLKFSRPMQENVATQHLNLIDANGKVVPNVFLDLQPELWNEERTVLTAWLDPGRIKRELIPNQQLGNPLIKGHRYSIAVSNNWKGTNGLPLKQSFEKQVIVAERDSVCPDIKNWQLSLPKAESIEPLVINFGEPLDFFLSQEAIKIIDENNKLVEGVSNVINKESKLSFVPKKEWLAGRYRVVVEPELEDLAGNNLIRPFDRDIRVKKSDPAKATLERNFIIKM